MFFRLCYYSNCMVAQFSNEGKLPPRILCPLSGIVHKEIMLPVRKWHSHIGKKLGIHEVTKLYLNCDECKTRVYLGNWKKDE